MNAQWIAAFGAATALFVVLAWVTAGAEGPVAFDAPALALVRQWRIPWATTFFRELSRVTTVGALAVPTALVAAVLWRHGRRLSLLVVAALAGSGLLTLGFKQWWGRLRPDAPLAVYEIDSYAFPSGHAATTTALLFALFLVARHRRPHWQRWAAAVAGSLVLLVGLARVYLGVHYPTDVLAGWGLGTAWGLLLQSALLRRETRDARTREARDNHV